MRKVLIFIRLVIFFTIMFFVIIVLGKIFTPKWKNGTLSQADGQDYTINGYYELTKNSIDVLFLGDSSIYKSVSPMEIYQQTGITSYNYSVSSARIYLLYYILEDAYKYQKPKVIMMDPLTLFYTEKEVEPERRKSFDYMRFSKVKYNMINDKFFEFSLKEKLTYYFPLFRYHSRWDNISLSSVKRTFGNYHSITKGYIMSTKINPRNSGFSYMNPSNKKVVMKDYTKKYLDMFVKFCKDNDIDLVFLGIPDTRAWGYEQNEELKKLVSDYNVKYLDLNNNSYGLDFTTDTEDKGMHLNLKGAIKVTNEVTKYLRNNYNFKDHRNDNEYQKWNEELLKYNKLKEARLKELDYKIDNKIYDVKKKTTTTKNIKDKH